MICIDHTALYAHDLEAMKEFFVTYFGACHGEPYHNPRTQFTSYFLTFGTRGRLEIMTRPEVDDAPRSEYGHGFIHMAFSVGGKASVDSLTARLQKAGYEVKSGPRTTGDGYYESQIVGPEGILIEITE